MYLYNALNKKTFSGITVIDLSPLINLMLYLFLTNTSLSLSFS